MLTPFGKLCRRLRIENGELLKEMAEKLQVTPSYLSAVENGKRNIPQSWLDDIAKIYAFSDEEKAALQTSIEESQLTMKVELVSYSSEDKNLIMAFAREIKDLNENDKNKIRNILLGLNKRGGNR